MTYLIYDNNIHTWLNERGLVPAESFFQVLRCHAEKYKKENKLSRIEDVYKSAGICRSQIHYWESHPYSTQTKHSYRHKIIANFAELFNLNETEKEALANSAGLSLIYGIPSNQSLLFSLYLASLAGDLKRHTGALSNVVSERMFEYVRKGIIPTKESALALGITLDFSLYDLQISLNRAGYALSNSLPNDIMIKWILQNNDKRLSGMELLQSINETLYKYGFPILMTREK